MSVAVLLSISVVEPLLCMIHCEIMALQATTTQTQAPASDMAMAMPGMAMAGMHHDDHAAATRGLPDSEPQLNTCLIGHSAPASDGMQPQPFHEMALVAMLLLVAAGGLWRRSLPPLQAPPQCFLPPLLRPPISRFLPHFA